MSEQEVRPTGQEVEPGGNAMFSSNGSDPGGSPLNAESTAVGWADDSAGFMADLARAMQATAATERLRDVEGTSHRRQAYIDAIRAREAIEAEELREFAKEDVKGIDAWSDGEIKRIKLERERRIAARRDQLQIRLEEHRAVVAREIEAVEAAITTYQTDVEQFFSRLEFETDPVEIARQAGARPAFPVLELITPEEGHAAYTAYPASAAASLPRMTPAEAAMSISSVAETEAVAETYTVAETDAVAETEVVAQTEAVAETEVVTQAEAVAETEVVAQTEAVAETEPVAQAEAAAVTEDRHDGNDGPVVGSMVGVMGSDSSSSSSASPWGSPVAATPEPVAVESPTTEGSDHSGLAEEPVAVVAETRVVMPRSTSAGSWLRWPNASTDRSDSGH